MVEVTSVSSDVNVSNATSTETRTESLTGYVSKANPIIGMAAILTILAVFNLGGNGFTVVTIRLTPRLWTKTNIVLASMLVSNISIAVLSFWYVPFILVVYVFNNHCRYNVVIAVTMPLMKISGVVSGLHLILVSIERYIAIVYPLKYETKFTYRTMKLAIAAIWATGILFPMTFLVGLINADLRKCDLTPLVYDLFEAVLAVLVYIFMFFCYGKIFAISWRHRQCTNVIDVNPELGTPVQVTDVISLPQTQSSNAGNSQDAKQKPLASTGPPTPSAVIASADFTEQQRKNIKSRRRQYKAVYLTAAIVGTFVILWFPHVLGRVLSAADYDPVVVNYLEIIGGALGVTNYAFTWAIYAAVSRSYRRAYRQLLIRIGCCCCKNITLPSDNSLVV